MTKSRDAAARVDYARTVAGDVRRAELAAWGRNIRLLRIGRGLTQEQLAFAAGTDKNTIGSLERGQKNVGVALVWRLAHAFGVRPADLFLPATPDSDTSGHLLGRARPPGPAGAAPVRGRSR